MKRLFVLSVALLTLISACNKKESKQEQPYLIVLSLDGFRWDYASNANTPVLDSLQKVGVIAESLIPSFPTKTFPNHYTIATGLYPDHHGIVENNFYAPDLDSYFSIGDSASNENPDFYGGEPIWVTAEKQGLNSATLFWVGSEAAIKGYRPGKWMKYNESLAYTSRVDTVFKWLSEPENTRPHLVMWYVDEPDHTGHRYGPEGAETIATVERLDSLLGYYFTRMRKLPIFDEINFIVTSDHGMGEISKERVIMIDQVIDTADIEFMGGWNPDFNLKVKPGKLEKVYGQLKNTPHLFTWKRDSLPQRLHYGTNTRTLDLTVAAYPGWAIASTSRPKVGGGAHGYDNSYKAMHAIFYAAGPAFKTGHVHPAFENVNIYSLIAKILDLNPAPTDGDIEHVRGMLK